MKYVILLCVAVQICLVHSQGEPAIVKISRNQEKNFGDSTEFKCKVENADGYPVVWLKDRGSKKSPLELSNGGSLVVEEDRYNLKFDKVQSSYNFKIDDLQQRDAGVYRCEIQLSPSSVVSAELVLKLSTDGSAF